MSIKHRVIIEVDPAETQGLSSSQETSAELPSWLSDTQNDDELDEFEKAIEGGNLLQEASQTLPAEGYPYGEQLPPQDSVMQEFIQGYPGATEALACRMDDPYKTNPVEVDPYQTNPG